jgi:hypothetical protein
MRKRFDDVWKLLDGRRLGPELRAAIVFAVREAREEALEEAAALADDHEEGPSAGPAIRALIGNAPTSTAPRVVARQRWGGGEWQEVELPPPPDVTL